MDFQKALERFLPSLRPGDAVSNENIGLETCRRLMANMIKKIVDDGFSKEVENAGVIVEECNKVFDLIELSYNSGDKVFKVPESRLRKIERVAEVCANRPLELEGGKVRYKIGKNAEDFRYWMASLFAAIKQLEV